MQQLTRWSRRGRLVALAALLGMAIGLPVGAIASHQFTDVPDSNSYHDDIDAIADAGVTTGCAAGRFCPKEFVTREQMAAFLNRLGALGPGTTPVVNATRLDGLNSTAFLRAQDIVTHDLGPWLVLDDEPDITVRNFTSFTRVTASSTSTVSLMLYPSAPTSFGNRTYGLERVQICYGDQFGTILGTSVIRASQGDADALITDLTDRPMDGDECYTLSDPTPNVASGGIVIAVTITLSTGVSAILHDVTTTWTPTTTP